MIILSQFRERRLRWVVAATVLAILAVVIVRVRLLNVPLERDEGEFAYEGQLMLDGVAPYSLVYHMKLPGTYAAYAGIMAIFGESTQAIHFGFLLANLAAVLLVFLVARRLIDLRGALVAAASYALLSASPSVAGLSAHATQLVALAAMAGFLMLLRARENGRNSALFWSGIFFGAAFLFKQPGLFFGAFGAAVLLRDELQRRPVSWGASFQKLAVYGIGMALPFLIACAAIWKAGTFNRFWFWTFDYAKVQATLVPAQTARYQLRLFFSRAEAMPVAWLLAAAGFVIILCQKEKADRRFLLTALLGCSLLAFITRFYFTGHYFIVMLPVVSLLIGIAISETAQAAERGARTDLAIWTQIAFLAACALFMFYNRAIWFELSPDAVSRKMYGSNPFPESMPLAAFLRLHTKPDARIAVLGSEPQIYFYAHRHSASGYINMYDLVQPHPYNSAMQQELIREVEAVKPEYFVFVEMPSSWLVWPGSDPHLLDWCREYSQKFYNLAGVIYVDRDHTDYAWGKKALREKTASESLIYIFERKT
jgi:general stress protein CsbA